MRRVLKWVGLAVLVLIIGGLVVVAMSLSLAHVVIDTMCLTR